MKQFTKEEIKQLATTHMFELNEEEIERCQVASAVFLKQIEQLDLIDTDAIEMMDMPFDTITTWLREDEVTHTMDHEAALSNAPKVEGDFIEIVKVLV